MTETPVDVEVIDPEMLPPGADGFDPCEEGDNLLDATPTSFLAFGSTSRHVLATWLPAAFDKWGVKYQLVGGWKDRGRPISAGYFDPNGLLIHHTGSTTSASNPHPALGIVTTGRSDLRGPLCQISTGFDGITRVVAAGRANHAGKARATMGNPAGDGNAMYLGNEVDTNGTQKMPDVQYQAVVLSSAAILDHFGYRDASKLGLHATTSLSGKWDLGAGNGKVEPYPISKLRADVTARLKAGPPKPPTPPAPPTPPTVLTQEALDVFAYQMPDHPDPKVAAAKIISDGFRARHVSKNGWARINGAIKAQTGKDLTVIEVADLEGIAVEWVGPQIPQSDGTPFQLPSTMTATS